jgi:hypothetical protein
MRSRTPRETMTLHHTLESATLRPACDLDSVTGFKNLNSELLAHLVFFTILHRDFTHELRRGLEAGFSRVSHFGFGSTLGLLGTEAELDGTVAIRLIGLHLDDSTRTRLDNGHGYLHPCLIEDSSHADLLSDQSGHRLVDLNLDVDPCRQIQLGQRVDRLWAAFNDVDESFMRPQFELLTTLLVDVRRAKHGPALTPRRQRDRSPHRRASLLRRPHNVSRGLIDHPVVERFQSDSDSFSHLLL